MLTKKVLISLASLAILSSSSYQAIASADTIESSTLKKCEELLKRVAEGKEGTNLRARFQARINSATNDQEKLQLCQEIIDEIKLSTKHDLQTKLNNLENIMKYPDVKGLFKKYTPDNKN